MTSPGNADISFYGFKITREAFHSENQSNQCQWDLIEGTTVTSRHGGLIMKAVDTFQHADPDLYIQVYTHIIHISTILQLKQMVCFVRLSTRQHRMKTIAVTYMRLPSDSPLTNKKPRPHLKVRIPSLLRKASKHLQGPSKGRSSSIHQRY